MRINRVLSIVEKGEQTFTFLNKEFVIFDFVLTITLIGVGLVWLIGLIIFLKKRRKKLETTGSNQKENPKSTTVTKL